MNEQCKQLKKNYESKEKKLINKYEDEIYDIDRKYYKVINELESENTFLRKVINNLQQTVEKFIHWICRKFSVSEEDNLIRDYEIENDTYFDPVKQIEHEQKLVYEEMER